MRPLAEKVVNSLLKEVSRSFYLTLRVLPTRVRFQIGLAYLLARTTDTIADTELVPLEQRLRTLQDLRDHISGSAHGAFDLAGLARHHGSAERRLLEQAGATLGLLDNLVSSDRQLVRQVLNIITGGQQLDLQRFAGATAGHMLSLQSDSELDDYTYRVAGCVGEFWTQICRAHLFPNARVDIPFLMTNGKRFGKGLQLVNILRDLPADLRHGRCYLPADRLRSAGLQPEQLLTPTNEPSLRPLYNRYLDQAHDHLVAGWAYTNALPRCNVRVRLACAWPALLGFETIKLLRSANVLDPARPIKVSRPELKRLIRRSVLLLPFPRAWRQMAPAISSPSSHGS